MKRDNRLKLQIPAAAGNLGPGLDTIGLALTLYCRVTFELLPEPNPAIPMVTYSGTIATQSPPKHADNLTYKVLNELWREDRALIDAVTTPRAGVTQHLHLALERSYERSLLGG